MLHGQIAVKTRVLLVEIAALSDTMLFFYNKTERYLTWLVSSSSWVKCTNRYRRVNYRLDKGIRRS